jgi:hypothetical protein
MIDEKEIDPLEEAEKKRAARKASAQKAANAQRAIDTLAIDEIEAELGDASIKAADLPHKVGLVTKIAVRCPTKAEIKRYRDMIKPDRKGREGDGAKANETLGATCRVYPPNDPGSEDSAAFDAVCEAFPGVLGQCGMLAAALSVADEEKAGKD